MHTHTHIYTKGGRESVRGRGERAGEENEPEIDTTDDDGLKCRQVLHGNERILFLVAMNHLTVCVCVCLS